MFKLSLPASGADLAYLAHHTTFNAVTAFCLADINALGVWSCERLSSSRSVGARGNVSRGVPNLPSLEITRASCVVLAT